MNYVKAVLILLSTGSCFITNTMIPDDLQMVTIPDGEGTLKKTSQLVAYLASKSTSKPHIAKKFIGIEKNTVSLYYPDKVLEFNFSCKISSCCISPDNKRVALSLEDKTIHSFPMPENNATAIKTDIIKSAEHPTHHICFGQNSTLVTINHHEIICATFDSPNPQHARFGLEDFDKFGPIITICPTDSPDEFIVSTKKENEKTQYHSLKLLRKK